MLPCNAPSPQTLVGPRTWTHRQSWKVEYRVAAWNRTRATGRLPHRHPPARVFCAPGLGAGGATPTAPPRRLCIAALAALPLAQAGSPQCRERPQQVQGGGRGPRGRPGFRRAPDLRGTRTVDPGGGRARPACGLPAPGSQEAPDLPSRPAAGGDSARAPPARGTGDRRSPVCDRSSLAMAPCPTAPCPRATSSRPLGAARAPVPPRPFASASRGWTGAAPAGQPPAPDRARAKEELSGSRTTPPRGEAGFPGPTPARRGPTTPLPAPPPGLDLAPSPAREPQARAPVRCPRPVRCSARPPAVRAEPDLGRDAPPRPSERDPGSPPRSRPRSSPPTSRPWGPFAA